MKMKILIHVHVSISTIYKLFLFFWQHQLSIPRHTPTTIKKLHHSIIVPKVRKNAISNDQDHFAQDVTYMCTTINRTCHVMYVFKIWTKWRFVIHWDVIMMLLQLQFYCMNMHRVVTTNGSLINWSDDLSPLYYHQNGRPVHFGSISLQVSLLNVYTSNEHRRVPNSKGQWDVSRKPTSIKIWRTLISGVIGRPVSLVESFHHFGRPLL